MSGSNQFQLRETLLKASMERLLLKEPLALLPEGLEGYAVTHRLGAGRIVFYPLIHDRRSQHYGMPILCTEAAFADYNRWYNKAPNNIEWQIHYSGYNASRTRETYGEGMRPEILSGIICMMYARDVTVSQAGILFRAALSADDRSNLDFTLDAMREANERGSGLPPAKFVPEANDF